MTDIEKSANRFPYWFYLLRGFAIFFITLIIKSVMGIRVLDTYSDMDINLTGTGAVRIPFFIISIIYFVGTFFLLNSVLNLFFTYDKRVMKRFLLEKPTKVKIGTAFKGALTSPEYWFEVIPLLLFTLLGTSLGWFPEISGSFSATGASDTLISWLPTIIMLPLTFLMTLWRRYEANRYWLHLMRVDNIEKLYNPFRLFLRLITLPLLYIVFYPLSPSFALVFVSISSLIVMFIDILSLLGFIGVIIGIIALMLGISALRSIRKRAKFIKKLKKTALDSGYTISEIKRPYASLFVRRNECNFTISKDGKLFSCHFVGSFWEGAPMFFVSDSIAYYLHRIGTKNHHLTFLSTFSYDFEGEGDKLLIINPVPRRMYVAEDEHLTGEGVMPWGGAPTSSRSYAIMRLKADKKSRESFTREITPGDKIWDYTVYNSTFLLGAIDRKCLGRYNGRFE